MDGAALGTQDSPDESYRMFRRNRCRYLLNTVCAGVATQLRLLEGPWHRHANSFSPDDRAPETNSRSKGITETFDRCLTSGTGDSVTSPWIDP